jgi:hypothetical protein
MLAVPGAFSELEHEIHAVVRSATAARIFLIVDADDESERFRFNNRAPPETAALGRVAAGDGVSASRRSGAFATRRR